MTTEAALQAFMISHTLMGDFLEKIQKAYEDFLEVNPEKVNWADVASANKICADLKEICRFINL